MSGADGVRNLSFRMTLPLYEARTRLVCLMSASLSLSRKVAGFSADSWVKADFCIAYNLLSVSLKPSLYAYQIMIPKPALVRLNSSPIRDPERG